MLDIGVDYSIYKFYTLNYCPFNIFWKVVFLPGTVHRRSNFANFCCSPLHKIPSEKESTQKGKNLLPWGEFLEQTLFLKGSKQFGQFSLLKVYQLPLSHYQWKWFPAQKTVHLYSQMSQLAFYVNLHRAVIGPSATLTGR